MIHAKTHRGLRVETYLGYQMQEGVGHECPDGETDEQTHEEEARLGAHARDEQDSEQRCEADHGDADEPDSQT